MNIKRSAVIAASAATVFSLALAAPSFAHGPKSSASTSSTSKAAHVHATVAVSVSGIPTSVTDAKFASKGARFVAYELAADATAIPTTQPTTGGKPVKLEGTTITDGVLTGTLKLHAGAASTTTNYAIYNAAGAGSFVTVTTDAAGVATATAASPITAAYVEPTAPAMGEGKGMKGDHSQGHGKRQGDRKHAGERMKMNRG